MATKRAPTTAVQSLLLIGFGVFLGLVLMVGGLLLLRVQQQTIFSVLFLEPDETLGWKGHPDFEFRWRGLYEHCVEFDRTVTLNNWGFHDTDWQQTAAGDTIRVALIGDSFVEAIQVEEPATAASRLETLLEEQVPGQDFEVMNFGVSNYSVGQFQLMYEHVARQFEPDYVFILVAYFVMDRTLQQEVYGPLYGEHLNIRPTYVFDDNHELRFVPQRDFAAYQSAYNALIDEQYGADRTVVKRPTLDWATLVSGPAIIERPLHPPPMEPAPMSEFPAYDLSMAIVERLAEQVRADGAELIFVDFTEYYDPSSSPLAALNQQNSAQMDIGYIDLTTSLRASNERVRFVCDGHFNERGNDLFARAMARWLQAHGDLSRP